jgi:hypothetical protein
MTTFLSGQFYFKLIEYIMFFPKNLNVVGGRLKFMTAKFFHIKIGIYQNRSKPSFQCYDGQLGFLSAGSLIPIVFI